MSEDFGKDSLFKHGFQFYAQVYTPYSEIPRADGFREAARTLLNRIDPSYEIKEKNETYTRNTLVYPIAYSFRHYLELRLKAIMVDLNYYVCQTPLNGMEKEIKKISDQHNLILIWKKILELREGLSEKDNDFIFGNADLKKIENRMNELSSIDAGSFAFRYPTKKCGATSIPLELPGFDVKNFVQKLDEISEMLEQISDNLAIAKDFLGDYLMSI